jgi:ketosteroid isomerase-like protein
MRSPVFLSIVFCLSLVALPVCVSQARQQAETVADNPMRFEVDVEAIKRINVDLIEAFNAGDVSAAVALVTEDAVDLPPNRPAVVGREAIRSFLQSDIDLFTMNFDDEIVDMEIDGSLAVIWSNYTVTLTPRDGGEPIKSSGKWLKVLKRQPGGSWKFSHNIWNSDKPRS